MNSTGCAAASNDELAHEASVYHPCFWSDFFIDTHFPPMQENIAASRVEELKEKVRSLLQHATGTDLVEAMNLIDSIQLLGLDYHFGKEIEHGLSKIYDANFDENIGLHETALRFRLLRQHGYHISPDIFNKFKDVDNGFMSSLKGDVKGLLSLYNAAYLRTHRETILDEAIIFTRSQLESVLSDLKPPLAQQVSSSLEIPLCRRIRRLLAREHISEFQEESTKHDAVLELAKLDYNILQSLHREEIKHISIWRTEYLAPTKYLNFARDRVVECYYWALAVCYEPKYSRVRVITAKVTFLVSIMDDIYDLHSTMEEGRQLVQAIERWDANVADELPMYMKQYYLMLIETFEKIEHVLTPNEKYRMFYLREMMTDLARGYFQEKQWASKQHVATVEEHLQLTFITSSMPTLICASFVGMGEEATEEVFRWLISYPTIVRACALIGRILNDITSHEREQTREHVASTVQCYMKEYRTDMNMTYDKLRCMVEDAWMDINEGYQNSTFPMALLDIIVNHSRISEVIYKDKDEFTNSSNNTKDNISALLVHSVPI